MNSVKGSAVQCLISALCDNKGHILTQSALLMQKCSFDKEYSTQFLNSVPSTEKSCYNDTFYMQGTDLW